MLTGTAFDTVVVLALIAIAHLVVSTFIATRLTRAEQTATEPRTPARNAAFSQVSANDQFRKAA